MDVPGNQTLPDIDPSFLLSLEEHATRLARQAGSLLLELFQQDSRVEYKSKGQLDPVTEADRKAEALLIEDIQRHFPDHGLLSEETLEPYEAQRDFLWVIDPLDGTNNFVNGYPFFGVSIGVLYRGIPVVGALFIPWPLVYGGYVIHARLGGGAFADDNPMRVYGKIEPSRVGLVAMPAYFRRQFRVGKELMRRLGDVRITGSITYELALVASGVLQYAAFTRPKIWDVAAGVIIVREAGGEVLVGSSSRRWERFHSFLETSTGLTSDGDIMKWGASLLMGNASVVDLVARNLRRRVWPRRWLWRLRAWRWARSRARELIAEDQARENPDDPEGLPPAEEKPPPLLGSTMR